MEATTASTNTSALRALATVTARQLSVVLPSALLGPLILSKTKENATKDAIYDLSTKVDSTLFEKTFGAAKEDIGSLLEAKTISIDRLLKICPPDTIDPSPFVFDTGLKYFAAMQVAAFLGNYFIYPVDPKLHEQQPHQQQPPIVLLEDHHLKKVHR